MSRGEPRFQAENHPLSCVSEGRELRRTSGVARRWWSPLTLALGLFVSPAPFWMPTPAQAQSATARSSFQLLDARPQLTHYLPEDGLSQTQILTMLQDQEGFIWIGTRSGGLNRFDGKQFRVYRAQDGVAASHVRVLLQTKDQLYVGTRQGLFRRAGERFEAIPTESGAVVDIYSLCSLPDGKLMVGTHDGLYELVAGASKVAGKSGAEEAKPPGGSAPSPVGKSGNATGDKLALSSLQKQLPRGGIWELGSSNDGSLWLLSQQWLGRITQGKYYPSEIPEDLSLSTLAVAGGTDVYVGTRRGLHVVKEDKLQPYQSAHPALQFPVSALYVDSRLRLHVSNRRGVVVLGKTSSGQLSATLMDERIGFPDASIRSFLEDREGNLYYGTDGDGLYQLPRQPFRTYHVPGLDDYAPVATLVDHAGRRFVATLGQGLWMVDGDQGVAIDDSKGLTSSDVTSLLQIDADLLWAGTGNGLFEVDLSSGAPVARQLWAVGNKAIIDLYADENKRYIASESGLWEFDGKRWNHYEAPQLPSNSLYDLHPDGSGKLWIGTQDSGAFLWDPTAHTVVQQLSASNGLPSNTIQSIFVTSDKTLWIGTDQGLVEKRGDTSRVWTTRDGLPDDTITVVSASPVDGTVWVGTNRGVASYAQNLWRSYSRRQGLPSDEVNTGSVWWDALGRLWVGTVHGFAVLEQYPPRINEVPPRVLITSAWQKDTQLDLKSDLTFPYSQNQFRFEFVGLSFIDPTRVQYRYRLAGLEEGWTQTLSPEARYPSLPPGRYTFEVLASNNDGVWAENPARFSFSVDKPFWETWWFRTLEVLFIFGAGIGVYALRAQRIKRLNQRLEAQVAERTQELVAEKDKSERLLLNILPGPIAAELREHGVATTRLYEDVTILFTDFQDFTRTCADTLPEKLVDELNEVFAAFDDICRAHRLEKLKTIGDAFMAAGGLPVTNVHHPIDAVEAAIEMMEYLAERNNLPNRIPFQLRIGIHTGPVVAGVIGKWKFAYDIWGDAVNTAARMESSGLAGEINLSRTTHDRVRSHFVCEPRGQVLAKGKGALEMFFVRRRVEPRPASPT